MGTKFGNTALKTGNNQNRSFNLLEKRKQWIWLGAIFLVFVLALCLRWSYVSTADVINPVRGDAAQYFKYAWNLANHSVFSGAEINEISIPAPDSYRDPGYPAFLAVLLKSTSNLDSWYQATLMTQVILGSLVIVFTILLASYWLPKTWALVAGLLAATWPHSVIFSGYLLTETLVSFLSVLGLWLLARAGKTQQKILLIPAGLSIGAAGLTNAILLPFGIGLALAGIIFMRKDAKFWLIFMLSACLLPSLWMVRNAQLPADGTSHNSTYRAYQNLVQGSWPTYHKAYKAMFSGDAIAKNIMTAIHAEIDLLAAEPQKGIDVIKNRLAAEPWHYFSWYAFEKPFLLWGWEIGVGQGDLYVYPTVNSPLNTNTAWRAHTSLMRGFYPIAFALVLLLYILVAFRLDRKLISNEPHARRALFATMVMLAYITCIYTLFQAEPRYSIPFRNLGLLLTTTCIFYIFSLIQSQRKSTDEPTVS